jgi:hypothetical protein
VSNREDHRLVDHVYDELSPNEEQTFQRLLADDPSMAEELASFESTLSVLREGLPAEDPSPHLDAKILAYARQAAAESEGASWLGRVRKFLRGPAIGLVAAGTAAIVGAFLVLPQMKEPTHDAPSVALEAAPARVNQAPAPTEKSAEVEPVAPPSELAFQDERAVEGVASGKAEATNVRLDDQAEQKRKVAKTLAKEMDGWERQAKDRERAPAGGLPGGPVAGSDGARGGGGGAEYRSDRVVARFDAPVEEAKKSDEAPAPKREATLRLEEERPRGEKGGAEADADDNFGEMVAAMPKDNPEPEAPVAPAAAPAPPPPLGASEGAGAVAEPPAKVARAAAARPASPAPSADKRQAATSPARATLGLARQQLGGGNLAGAAKLAERGVALAKNTPEWGWALLEAAEILYACGQYGPAERYAAQARSAVEVAARPRAERLMKQARSKASESDSAPATTTY